MNPVYDFLVLLSVSVREKIWQILSLKLSAFERVNKFPWKTSENHRFSDDFSGNRS